jgi:exonuclease SbcD
MEGAGIHLSPVYNGTISHVTLSDEYGDVHFWLLPFIKPAHVKRFYPEENMESYTDAIRVAVEKMGINPEERNVLLTHQFVTGSVTCESEELSIGGSDNVDAAVFEGFDYVALGHIHGRQSIGGSNIRYSGTPYKYSVSEAGQEKSITLVTLGEKGSQPQIEYIDLECRPQLRRLRGSLDEVVAMAGDGCDDFVSITLTDENPVRPRDFLDEVYSRILEIRVDNTQTRTILAGQETIEAFPEPSQAFADFFREINGTDMNEAQQAVLNEVVEAIKGREEES